MPVPASINDLSTTAGSNSPAGSETPAEGDNYIRSHGSFIALLRDKLNGTSNTGTVKNATFSGTMAGAASWAGLQTFAAGLASTTGTFSGAVTATTGTFSGAVTASNAVGGAYTPTATAGTNVSSATGGAARYIRLGDIVHVSGAVTIDPTSASTSSSLTLSLPIASNLGGSNLSGIATIGQGTGIGQVVAVIGDDSVNNTAQMAFVSGSDTASRNWSFQFTYSIV
jgi:hypothetical protein